MMTMHLISASAAFWSPTQATPSATAIGPRRLVNFTSRRSVSPGFAIARNLALSMPVYTAVLPRNSGMESSATPPTCASASRRNTAGMIGLPGKWPWKKNSSPVRCSVPTTCSSSISRTSSTSSMWGAVRKNLHDLFFIQHISYTSFLSSTRGFAKYR